MSRAFGPRGIVPRGVGPRVSGACLSACVVVLGLLLPALGGPARAEEPAAGAKKSTGAGGQGGVSAAEGAKLQAQTSLEEGVRLFRQNDFLAAREAFQRALNFYPDPKIFFNLAQTERALGNAARAYRGFSRFLRESSKSTPAVRAEAERHLSELLPLLGRLDFHPELAAGWEVRVDEESFGLAPLADPLLVAPGRHRATLRDALGNVVSSQLVTVQAGGAAVVTVPQAAGSPAGSPILVAPNGGAPPPNGNAPVPARSGPSLGAPSLTGPSLLDGTGTADGTGTGGAAGESPFYRHVWFWLIVGGVVAAGATTVYLVSRKDCGYDTCLRP